MKKAISLVLALIMCLSLCACGESSQQAESGGKKEDIYASALLLLEESQSTEENASEKVKEAYELLVSLGEYEGAKDYLSKITSKEVCVLKETVQYDAFEQILESSTVSYEHDAFGRVICETNSAWGQSIYTEYNAEGNVEKTILTDGDLKNGGHILSEYTYSYNEDSKMTVRFEKRASGREQKIYYKYDNKGNLVKVESEKGTFDTYAYDELNRLVEMNYYLSSDSLGMSEKYFYDDNGSLCKKETVYPQGDLFEAIYTYSGEQPILVETYNMNNSPQSLASKETYTYETLYFYNP